MVIKLPRMKKNEVKELLSEQILCRIAFKGAEYPYIAPFQYVYLNGSLYFHFTNYGRKMRLLESDDRVCVEIEQFQPDLSEYFFVSLRGVLRIVDDPHKRTAVIRRMAEDGEKKLSPNFLAAHGLKIEEGWSSLTSEKPLLIFKLEIREETGVKSPYI